MCDVELLSVPRLVIGAPQGRSGKTTVTLGLCAALAARGLAVQPFKKGPDYIDPSWLSEGAGRPCRSLDPFFCGDDERLIAAFLDGASGAHISIIEGNHGLYDGLPFGRAGDAAAHQELLWNRGFTRLSDQREKPARVSSPESQTPASERDESFGSTAAVARSLAAPILLVVNAARMGRSAAALVHGYLTFEPETPIRGVILNDVAHGRHEDKLRRAIERHCGVPVLGAFPRDESLTIPDRHLGLVPRPEDDGLLRAIVACRAAAERRLDLDAIVAMAQAAPALRAAYSRLSPTHHAPRTTQRLTRLAVFRDRAFTFYYPENLEALVAAGAELAFVDALRDAELPAVEGLVIGGGFPELFMDELSANVSLRRAVRQAVEAGLPVYAECGGLMYLARRIIWGERTAEMAGVLPCDVEMTARPQGHGYAEAVVDAQNPFFPAGTVLRGHEFHNSLLRTAYCVGDGVTTAYRLARGNGIGEGRDGLVYRNVLASYMHLHAAGAPGWAPGLVQSACKTRGDR